MYIPFQVTSALANRGKNVQVVSKSWKEHSLMYPGSKLRKLKYFVSNITRIQSSFMCSERESRIQEVKPLTVLCLTANVPYSVMNIKSKNRTEQV